MAQVHVVKGFLISAVTAALFVGAVYAFNKAGEPDTVPHEVAPAGELPGASSADGGTTLRDQLLHATAQQLGIVPVGGVWGVLMERGYAKGVATVVALADGTASMYLSTGGSVVGGKAYPPARRAALKLCEQAADSLAETNVAHDFPPPSKGRVRFYVLAADGVHAAEGAIFPSANDGGRDAVAPLLAAGDAVLDGLKEATSKGLIR